MRHQGPFAAIAAAAVWLLCCCAHAATVEEETLKRLELIRAMQPGPGQDQVETQNRQMDEAWKYFREHKAEALPVLRRELERELALQSPGQLLVLDIGHFLRLQEEAADRELGKRAFLALDPKAQIVRWNTLEFFEFAHEVAEDRDPNVLPRIDAAFLRVPVEVFIPQHALKLDETLVCVFLYGPYGREGEAHLAALLDEAPLQRKILETLSWIGSPRSLSSVARAMASRRDFETFARATAFMMQAAGPEGRAFMLQVKPGDYDEKSQQYYAKVRPAIDKTSFETFAGALAKVPGADSLSDDEVRKHLQSMYQDYGREETMGPSAIVRSRLPKQYLIGQMEGIRARTLHRLSDEALSDLEITNVVINGLRFRPD